MPRKVAWAIGLFVVTGLAVMEVVMEVVHLDFSVIVGFVILGVVLLIFGD